jgi:heme/copper-type cytochrome/quinol oxidase subunit 3
MTDATIQGDMLPVGSIERRTNGWYGMLTVIMTEGALFAYLLFSYYYFAVQYGREWLPPQLPEFWFSVPNTILLLASSAALWFAERGVRRGIRRGLVWGLAIAIGLAVIYVVLQAIEWSGRPFTMSSTPYGSLYFSISGLHFVHLAIGLIILVVLLIWSLLNYFDARRYAAVSIGAVYWYFVTAVWLAVFFTIYITPRLG